MAEKAGLSRQTIAFVEDELRNPTLNTLFRLTLAMELDAGKIIQQAVRLASETKSNRKSRK